MFMNKQLSNGKIKLWLILCKCTERLSDREATRCFRLSFHVRCAAIKKENWENNLQNNYLFPVFLDSLLFRTVNKFLTLQTV